MTAQAEQLGQSVVAAVKAFVTEALSERDKRLDALEAKEAQTLADAYRGAYQPNSSYVRGSVVNHHSSLWLCMSETTEPPGSTCEWRLILKGQR